MSTTESDVPVLYDGWSLVHQSNSSAALYLWGLLVNIPAGFRPVVALPGEAPDWLPGFPLQTAFAAVEDTPWGRLKWEQRLLPVLARQVQARLIHLCTGFAPLFPGVPVVASLVDYDIFPSHSPPSFADRLRRSIGAGGLARAAAALQPDDLHLLSSSRLKPVTPFSLPQFSEMNDLAAVSPISIPFDPGDSFVLYHGPTDLRSLHRLFSAWSWAAASSPTLLILVGVSPHLTEVIANVMQQYDVADTVLVLPSQPPAVIAGLYRDCTALFHPAEVTAWGEPVRSALICGKPIVAAYSPQVDALVGPAAYLAPMDDSRALGAALLSVLVDENLAEQLAQAARLRSAAWRTKSSADILLPIYHAALSMGAKASRQNASR